MRWLPFHANGLLWISRSKPGWSLWAQDGLSMDHWHAGEQGCQPDLQLLWAWKFFYLPLWLCQGKKHTAIEILNMTNMQIWLWLDNNFSTKYCTINSYVQLQNFDYRIGCNILTTVIVLLLCWCNSAINDTKCNSIIIL